MIPGTPLIISNKLMIFHERKSSAINCFSPYHKAIISSISSSDITYIDGTEYNHDSIVLYKWNSIIPDNIMIDADFHVAVALDNGGKRIIGPELQSLNKKRLDILISIYAAFKEQLSITVSSIKHPNCVDHSVDVATGFPAGVANMIRPYGTP